MLEYRSSILYRGKLCQRNRWRIPFIDSDFLSDDNVNYRLRQPQRLGARLHIDTKS